MNPSSLAGHILEIIRYIEGSNSPPDRIVKDFFRSRKYLGSHDRRTIANSVFGLLRHRRLAETLLDHYIKNNPGTEILSDPALKALPLLVCYSELIDSAVKVPAAYWTTHFPKNDHSQYLDWLRENSSLDFLSTDNLQKLGVRYSFPEWMVRAWNDLIGDETESLLSAMNAPAPTTLRVNILRTNREECQRRLNEEGTVTEPTKFSPVGLIAAKRFNSDASQAFKEGWFEIQDEGSQLISLLVQPKPGYVVIDACAGAGGKSIHMAELMNNDGGIIALDIDQRRLNNLRKRAERGGITIIRTGISDEIPKNDTAEKADIVLIDAPCSGSGTIRRNPGLKWSITPALVKHYSDLQLGILGQSVPYLKPDGIIVYSTCSLFTEENEAVVKTFLDNNPGYEIIPIGERLQPYNLSIHDSPLSCHNSTFTLLPHRHSTDGFFIAVMKKVS